MKAVLKLFSVVVVFAVAISSCKKENAEEETNDNELITTVLLSIKQAGAASGSEYTWKDVDGAGGQDPEIDTIILVPNKAYDVQVGVLDESGGTPVSLTSEILEEADAHRFYFTSSPGLGITASGFDKDDNNVSVGLNCTWETKAASDGSITITLRHYPNGSKEETDPVNSSKSTTDAEVVFPVKVVAP